MNVSTYNVVKCTPVVTHNLSPISVMAGKRRRRGIEYYDDLDLPDTTAVAKPATVQSVQRYTEITMTHSHISTTQSYYEVNTPRLSLPKPVISKIEWNTQPKPDTDDFTFDEPLNFIDPPDVVSELEATADRSRGDRKLGVGLLFTTPRIWTEDHSGFPSSSLDP